jgi:DNA-binding transcriptional ArsR family regulator
MMSVMARAATTADAFNAVAEPRRRQILDALADGERPVNDLAALLGQAQPLVSKHLRLLRKSGWWRCAATGGSGFTGSTAGRSGRSMTG